MKKLHGRMRFAGLLAALVGFAAGSQAATVTLTETDAYGESSFESGLHWSDTNAPSAGNDYVVPLQWLRSPTVSSME